VKQLVSAIPILLLLAAAPSPAAAQSISPPISEYRGLKARGSFIVTNQTLFPLTVVLQPKGFKVTEDGDLYDVPLDTNAVKLRLSAMSFRLQPRQAYTVFYEATTDTVPYWFNVWSGITGSKTESGINLRIELPHVVYLYQKQKLAAADITIRSVRYRPADKQIVVEFANASPRLGRVQSVVASAERARNQEAAGFPLFPESIRRMRMPWADSLPPQKVEVRFDGFRLNSTDIVVDTTAAGAPDSSATR
jgi:hypothetical protein